DSRIEVTTQSRPLPEDSIPKEEQWTSLQVIKHQVPFIDFLKQEPCEVVDEIKRGTHVGQYMQVTPLTTAQKLNEYVYNEFQYIKGVTSIETTPDEIWKLKAGVCQ